MPQQSHRVLLIEDDSIVLRFLCASIQRARPGKFDIESAQDLATAMERLRTGGFDVALLDLVLPDSHGLDTLRRVRAAAPLLPVVVLTATDDEEVSTEAIRLGAHDYLVKGSAPGEVIVRAMSYAIERHRLHLEMEAERVRGRQERLRVTTRLFSRPSQGHKRGSTQSLFAPLKLRAAEAYSEIVHRLIQATAEARPEELGSADDRRFDGLRDIAEDLASLHAGPTDVIDAMKSVAEGRQASPVRGPEEDRDDLLDLMSILVACYRRRCKADAPEPKA